MALFQKKQNYFLAILQFSLPILNALVSLWKTPLDTLDKLASGNQEVLGVVVTILNILQQCLLCIIQVL